MKKKRKKNAHAVGLAKKRSASLSPERRSQIARNAALARWGSRVPKEDA